MKPSTADGASGTGSADITVAIDGPAGVGKSTLAQALAAELNIPYINTGLMYRGLAARALQRGIDLDDTPALAREAAGFRFAVGGQPPGELLIDGRPPGPELTTAEVEEIVSRVSRHAAVREVLRRAQRDLRGRGCVMEGRDIGTEVLADADVKIFLMAPPAVRARRRARQRATGDPAGEPPISEALTLRDAQDAATNPLVPSKDAYTLETAGLSPQAVLRAALSLVRRRVGQTGRNGAT